MPFSIFLHLPVAMTMCTLACRHTSVCCKTVHNCLQCDVYLFMFWHIWYKLWKILHQNGVHIDHCKWIYEHDQCSPINNSRQRLRWLIRLIKCLCHIDALIGLQCHSYQYQICAKILQHVSIATLWAELAECKRQNFCLPILRVASVESTRIS